MKGLTMFLAIVLACTSAGTSVQSCRSFSSPSLFATEAACQIDVMKNGVPSVMQMLPEGGKIVSYGCVSLLDLVAGRRA